jgi:tetratricopeptide (TPR) repeat protein
MSYSRRTCAVLAALLGLAGACPAFACVNTFESDIVNQLRSGDARAADEIVQDLTQKHAKQPTLENSNDLGVARLLTGKLDDAIALFRETEKGFPNSAKVAANLGTALELKGENEEALSWIREGIKRDANERRGSEWLHARILEAKIALKNDPRWLERNRVLDLDFGKEEVPTAPEILPIENGKVKGAVQLVDQITYLLDERTKLVKPPDAIVGDLYASAADLAIAGAISPLDERKSTLSPEGLYEEALKYGAPRSDLIRKRLARYKADFTALPPAPKEEVADYPLVKKRFDKAPAQSGSLWIYVGAATLFTIVLVVAGMLIDRRRRRRAEALPVAPLPDVD